MSTAISPHLPRLRELASQVSTAVEFGVKRGASSCALLSGLSAQSPAGHLTSYDIVEVPEARGLANLAGELWDYRIEDSRTADVPAAELLFVDSLHTYEQVKAELAHAADKISRFLVFHDVSTFGEVGADGESGRQQWTYVAGKGSVPVGSWGIRPAIDELMIRDPSWRIVERRVGSHGLLVLKRWR